MRSRACAARRSRAIVSLTLGHRTPRAPDRPISDALLLAAASDARRERADLLTGLSLGRRESDASVRDRSPPERGRDKTGADLLDAPRATGNFFIWPVFAPRRAPLGRLLSLRAPATPGDGATPGAALPGSRRARRFVSGQRRFAPDPSIARLRCVRVPPERFMESAGPVSWPCIINGLFGSRRSTV